MPSTNGWNWSGDVMDVAGVEGREAFNAVGDLERKLV